MRMMRAALIGCGGLVALGIASRASAQYDGVWWEFEAGILQVHHDTQYNCAVDGLQHLVTFAADTLVVEERALAPALADCYCPYRTRVDVAGLAAGSYTLRYGYGEVVAGEPPTSWTWCDLPLEIPATAGPGEQDVTMVEAWAEGCGIAPVAVPDVDGVADPVTWGVVKSLYR